jgi:serine/threonine protein kinase
MQSSSPAGLWSDSDGNLTQGLIIIWL